MFNEKFWGCVGRRRWGIVVWYLNTRESHRKIMRGSSVRFWWVKGCMTCVSGGRNTFTVSSHNLWGSINHASIMLPTRQESRSQTIFQTLLKSGKALVFQATFLVTWGIVYALKNIYHNCILHSGLELSNSLDLAHKSWDRERILHPKRSIWFKQQSRTLSAIWFKLSSQRSVVTKYAFHNCASNVA